MKTLSLISCALLLCSSSYAQSTAADNALNPKSSKFHLGLSLDPIAYSKGRRSGDFVDPIWSEGRFNYLGAGVYVDYDASKYVGLYSGVDVKKIGYEGLHSYNVSIPLGIRVGYLSKNEYLTIGGGFDVPLLLHDNRYGYTEKNEWLSSQIATTMEYISVGAVYKIFSFKAQYYISNLLNQKYADFISADSFKEPVIQDQPYKYTVLHPMVLSLGVEVPFSKMNKAGVKTLLK
jgi:hypothetical protein